MATLRYRYETLGNFRGALGGQVDGSTEKPLRSGTLPVTATATASGSQPQAPSGAGDSLFLTLSVTDAPVYADIGTAPDPTLEPRHLVLPGSPLRLHVGAGERLAVVLATDIPAASPVSVTPFTPLRPQTYTLAVGPTATTAPVTLPALAGATSYRVRNPTASASPITWVLATANTAVPTVPAAFSTAGTGGTAGDKTIDPGGVETFALTAAQQTALAAGTLYWAAITSSGGSGTLSITFGNGG